MYKLVYPTDKLQVGAGGEAGAWGGGVGDGMGVVSVTSVSGSRCDVVVKKGAWAKMGSRRDGKGSSSSAV